MENKSKQADKYALIKIENLINPIETNQVVNVLHTYITLEEAQFDFRNHPNCLEDNVIVLYYVISLDGININNINNETYQDRIVLTNKKRLDHEFISRIIHRYVVIKRTYDLNYKDANKSKIEIMYQFPNLNDAMQHLNKFEDKVLGTLHETYCVVDMQDHIGEDIKDLDLYLQQDLSSK